METQQPDIMRVALALGSNIGDRQGVLRAAINGLGAILDIVAVSPVYETPPVYVQDQPRFLNAALIGTTRLLPVTLLWNIKQLEVELGREPTFRYGPRRLDIDILSYGDRVIDEPELHVPHPRMSEREFVLRPLADIAPDWVNPRTGRNVAAMLQDVASSELVCLGPL